MIVLGLTGSIAMGKSQAASSLRRLGIAVHDADAAVHRLLGRGGAAVRKIEAAFPGITVDGAVDRRRLGDLVFRDDAALARLEAIVHPLVRADTRRFLQRAALRGEKLVVLDVPLLFERGLWRDVDGIIVVSAPKFLQTQRALARPGMSLAKLNGILAKQTPDAVKRNHAHWVVHTGLSRGSSFRRLQQIVEQAKLLPARHWPPRAFLPTRKALGPTDA